MIPSTNLVLITFLYEQKAVCLWQSCWNWFRIAKLKKNVWALPVKIWAVQKEGPILNFTARFALKLQMSVRACNLRKSVIIKVDRDMILTRKHSSRVRTARLQTICVSVIDHQMLLPGEGEGGASEQV